MPDMYIQKIKCASLLLPPEKSSFNYRASDAHVVTRTACACAGNSTHNLAIANLKKNFFLKLKMDMVTHVSNPKIQEVEAGGL